MDITDSVVLVTGGNRGLGTALVTGASQGKETLLRVLPQWEQLQAHMVTGIEQEQLVPFLAQLAWTSNSSF